MFKTIVDDLGRVWSGRDVRIFICSLGVGRGGCYWKREGGIIGRFNLESSRIQGYFCSSSIDKESAFDSVF